MIAAEAPKPEFLRMDGLRLLLFGGKGGVGKTTCAAAAALHLAQQHPERAYLLVSTDPAHSLADCFADSAPPDNLTLRELNPQESLARFKAQHETHLRTIALRGTFLDQTDVGQLLDLSVPGLDEVMALLEIAAWVKAERYSAIVVDTAPAGHTLRLLALPLLMQQWLSALDTMLAKHRYMTRLYLGVYSKDAADLYLEQTAEGLKHLLTLLRAPERCRFVPVMLAEALSLHVTQILLAELERLGLGVRDMVVNRLLYPQTDCPVCAEWSAGQIVAIEQLTREFSGHRLWGLPLILEELRGKKKLSMLWQQVRTLMEATSDIGNGAHLKAPGRRVFGIQYSAVRNPAPLFSSSMKLLLFAGKGGVGKTTLACASALRLAEQRGGKEVLLFSIDPAHSIAACLGCEIGPREVRVAPGLSAIELDAAVEYARLKQDYARELSGIFEAISGKAGIDIAFDREVMQRMLDLAPPGLDEILALTRVVELMERGRYDLFVLDTAPTGHLLRFLEMPELIEQWLRTFFGLFLKYRQVFWLPKISRMMVDLSKRVKWFRRMLIDPGLAALVAVTIPTEMAQAETKDLLSACERLGVATPIIFVNLVTPDSGCPTCSALHRAEKRVLGGYETERAGRHLALVYRQEELRGLERLRALGQELYLDSDSLNESQAKGGMQWQQTVIQ